MVLILNIILGGFHSHKRKAKSIRCLPRLGIASLETSGAQRDHWEKNAICREFFEIVWIAQKWSMAQRWQQNNLIWILCLPKLDPKYFDMNTLDLIPVSQYVLAINN